MEAEELRDTELVVGDKRLGFLLTGIATEDERDLPLPRTLPPPSCLVDIDNHWPLKARIGNCATPTNSVQIMQLLPFINELCELGSYADSTSDRRIIWYA